MQAHHVVVGAGPVGTAVTALLAERGDRVVLATRRGIAPKNPSPAGRIEPVALDASDADALTAVAEGASAIYNCANPGDYTSWDTIWPPLATAFRTAAARTGAVLAITGNLYPYGPVPGGLMTEGMPDTATDHKGQLRARMWADCLADHRAGLLRAVEVRGSDYVGDGVGENGHVTRLLPRALAGRTAWAIDAADQPHSWTDVHDMAHALIAAVDRPDTHGHVWHAPTNEPRTLREALADVLAAAGKPNVRVRVIPRALTVPVGLVVPMFRELNELSYQRTAPYILDSRRSCEALGIAPSPWADVCARTLAPYLPPTGTPHPPSARV